MIEVNQANLNSKKQTAEKFWRRSKPSGYPMAVLAPSTELTQIKYTRTPSKGKLQMKVLKVRLWHMD